MLQFSQVFIVLSNIWEERKSTSLNLDFFFMGYANVVSTVGWSNNLNGKL